MYTTDENKLKINSYFNKKTLNVKCNAGNSGNVNLRLFTVQYTVPTSKSGILP